MGRINKTVLIRTVKYFLLFFVTYFVISYFIRDADEPFFGFRSFSKMVVFAAFMSLFFVRFSSERSKDGTIQQSAEVNTPEAVNYFKFTLTSAAWFLLLSFPLLLLLYFFFSLSQHESINLGREILKLLVFTVLLSILMTLYIRIAQRWNRNRIKVK
jgi:hypothetical protein